MSEMLDFLNKFLVPALAFIWVEIRAGRSDIKAVAKEVHKIDKRVVRIETKLQLTPLED
jgi:hypothetical protein